MSQSETSSESFDAFELIDKGIQSGELVVGADGVLAPKEGDLEGDLKKDREARKLQEAEPEDDSSPQEIVLLGWALRDTDDNTALWARFRSALGLMPAQEIPGDLWTSPERRAVSRELDAIFRGQRDVTALNGRNLLECYMARQERGQVAEGMQAIGQTVRQLQAQATTFHENDLTIAVDLLKSNRARAQLRSALGQGSRGLRADQPVHQVVASLAETIEGIRSLVRGRLGTSHSFATVKTIGGQLRDAMTAIKGRPIPTGIDAIDIDIQGGVNPARCGKLHCIAARQGVGKTTVAIGAAMGLVRNGADVLFLSSELDDVEINARAFANQARANGFDCPSWILEGMGKTNEPPKDFDQADEVWRMQREAGEVGEFLSKSFFRASAEDFIDYMSAAKSKNPRLAAVFMDHFHAMMPTKGYATRSTEMEARALELMAAAKACKVDLFLLAQLNREAAQAPKPTKDHINGTDVIGQLASAVVCLEFPKRGEHEPFDPAKLVLHHSKMRNGQRRDGKPVTVEESGLKIHRDSCTIVDAALPFS